LNDREGEWWLATALGLFRFPKTDALEQLSRTAPKAIYTVRDGLADGAILRIFEDSRDDIWISCAGDYRGLSRWERATNTFHHYTEEDGLPSRGEFYATSFCEDGAGDVWAGFSAGGGLLRYRGGRFAAFTTADGLPGGGIFNLYVDSVGRLWAPTTRGGVFRIDNPTEDHLTGRAYTTADGLSSNDVRSVTEDRFGRVYFGTGRGIDRLDPLTGRIRHYGTAEGALLGDIQAAAQDQDGALWFSFPNGTVRLVPEPDSAQQPPAILITGLRVAGDPYLVSALGETEVGPLRLGPGKNNVQVDFVALGSGTGEDLKYQYRLEGGNEDWSPFTTERTVNFANLAPGRYRMQVRATGADGALSEPPASLSFRILPPIWQQWWFLALAAVVAGLLAYSLVRYRVRQLLEIERVRTRIAADLHDDIGSNLSQIAVWSEVAQQQAAGVVGGQRPGKPVDDGPEPLERIASTARETASAMSDIVWAINPSRDYLGDLISRMRRFAAEAFDSRDIDWQLDAPQTNLGLNAGTRREVFLIFKECVNNIIRHSRSNRVETAVTIEGNRLRLHIRDDGCGFDPRQRGSGHGLDSLRQRARNLEGTIVIASAPGQGTTIDFEMPLQRSRWRR
jgi:signal transduction histidine kinase